MLNTLYKYKETIHYYAPLTSCLGSKGRLNFCGNCTLLNSSRSTFTRRKKQVSSYIYHYINVRLTRVSAFFSHITFILSCEGASLTLIATIASWLRTEFCFRNSCLCWPHPLRYASTNSENREAIVGLCNSDYVCDVWLDLRGTSEAEGLLIAMQLGHTLRCQKKACPIWFTFLRALVNKNWAKGESWYDSYLRT